MRSRKVSRSPQKGQTFLFYGPSMGSPRLSSERAATLTTCRLPAGRCPRHGTIPHRASRRGWPDPPEPEPPPPTRTRPRNSSFRRDPPGARHPSDSGIQECKRHERRRAAPVPELRPLSISRHRLRSQNPHGRDGEGWPKAGVRPAPPPPPPAALAPLTVVFFLPLQPEIRSLHRPRPPSPLSPRLSVRNAIATSQALVRSHPTQRCPNQSNS
jgi:hypothetical protein